MPVESITCRVTQWYFKRMSLMSLMFIGFGLFFLYDGFVRYPKKNRIFDEHAAFEARREAFATLREAAPDAEWGTYARERGWPLEVTWKDYAATRHWPEKKPDKRYTVNDQFFFGALCCALGLGILGTMLLHRNRQLKASETAFVTPEGTEVPFASSFRIDKRKWANKGLAYVHYRDATGRERRAVIDDLKYEGAERVLARLMEHFQGEILDRVDETEGGLDEHDESDTAPGSDVIQTERSRDGDGSFVEPKSPGDRR